MTVLRRLYVCKDFSLSTMALSYLQISLTRIHISAVRDQDPIADAMPAIATGTRHCIGTLFNLIFVLPLLPQPVSLRGELQPGCYTDRNYLRGRRVRRSDR